VIAKALVSQRTDPLEVSSSVVAIVVVRPAAGAGIKAIVAGAGAGRFRSAQTDHPRRAVRVIAGRRERSPRPGGRDDRIHHGAIVSAARLDLPPGGKHELWRGRGNPGRRRCLHAKGAGRTFWLWLLHCMGVSLSVQLSRVKCDSGLDG
jgi:hypothetical protein